MISQHHDEIWRAVTRQLHDAIVHELYMCQQGVRDTYYTELMDTEGGGYGYMLDSDGVDEELEWCVQVPARVLQYIHDRDLSGVLL